ncbi:MAG: hypothetical protein V3R25_08520 [Nitrosomonadaceae bacterium]
MAHNNVAPLAVFSGSTLWNVVFANDGVPPAAPAYNTCLLCWAYNNVTPVVALERNTSCNVDVAVNEAATAASDW